ncbi:hypothetical protein FJT64_013158 [Amphibalanus amphitrite]|uniref:Uncharacterized protein n=1 Tax=Amphibalanus amphitrite TaxID=1232801 RepID=A0A6A4VB69_AMPAM|nr:hypothetical protein FJT64_013158 [Amphibalanus amphitrite]
MDGTAAGAYTRPFICFGIMTRQGVLRSKASLRGLYDIRHRHPDVQFLMTSHLNQGCPENLLVLTACC